MDTEPVERRRRSVAAPQTRIARELWWVALTLALAVFLATGRVSTFRGIEGRSRSSVWSVWRDLTDDLPTVGSPGLLTAGYILLVIVFLGGCLTALWLALAADVTDESSARPIGSDGPVQTTTTVPAART